MQLAIEFRQPFGRADVGPAPGVPFALDVAALELPARFTAGDVLQAIHGHKLDEALVYGTYTLNPSLRG